MAGEQALLMRLYEAYRIRDIDALLSLMHPDVEWATGPDGEHLRGHDAVRADLTGQWAETATYLDPLSFSVTRNDRTAVQVVQTVRDMQGKRLSEKTVGHIVTIRDGLIERLDIREG